MAIPFRLNDRLLFARKAWVKYGIYVVTGISTIILKVGHLMEITHVDTSVGFAHDVGVLISQRRENIVKCLQPRHKILRDLSVQGGLIASVTVPSSNRLINIEDIG